MTTNRLRQIHDITDNFFFWQGLRLIPMGAGLLGSAVLLSPDVPIRAGLREWIALPLLAIALWLSTSVLGQYYSRHFGRVRGDPSRHVARTTVKWLVVYPGLIVAMLVDVKIGPPVVVSGFAFAIAIEAYRQSTGGGRVHYIVAAIALIAFSVLPLIDVVQSGRHALTPLIGIVGLIYMVGGVLDHRELVRVLSPVEGEERVASL